MPLRRIIVERNEEAETKSIDPLIKSIFREMGDDIKKFHAFDIERIQDSSVLASGDKIGIRLGVTFDTDEVGQIECGKILTEIIEKHPLLSTFTVIELELDEDDASDS